MPVALLVAEAGDVRDAVGLYLAGCGWTTVPLAQDPALVGPAVAGLAPGLVAVDFRGRPDAAAACVLSVGPGVTVLVFNAPDGYAPPAPTVRQAHGPSDVPRAPGVPGPPH